MRRLGQVVLMALVMQLTGIAGVCAPRQPQAEHDCCTPSQQEHRVSQRPAPPECCFVSAVREHGSIGQTKAPSENFTSELPLAERTPIQPAAYQPAAIYRQIVTHPVSPPISPLKLTCLLLI